MRFLRRGFSEDRYGVTNVVSLVLITGIVISLIGLVFTSYLPAWGKDVEAQTLNSVMDSFMDLKGSMDTLSVNGDEGVSLTTSIKLGSTGGPVFGFGRMTGSLEVNADWGRMVISDTGVPPKNYGISRGSIEYKSSNNYVDEQNIHLEGGAIVREQLGSSVIKGPPNIIISEDAGGELILYVLSTSIEGEMNSYSGTGTNMITMTLISHTDTSYDIPPGSGISITIRTMFGLTWEGHMDGYLQSHGLVRDTDYSISLGSDPEGFDTFGITFLTLDRMDLRTTFFSVYIT